MELPPDTFLVYHGYDGYGAEIVTGLENAKMAFAKLWAGDDDEETLGDMLEYANDSNNWMHVDGHPVELEFGCGDIAKIVRITFP